MQLLYEVVVCKSARKLVNVNALFYTHNFVQSHINYSGFITVFGGWFTYMTMFPTVHIHTIGMNTASKTKICIF